MQQESRVGLHFLWADGKVEDSPRELVNIQASHAETVLELQKTRKLLLLEHRISKDLQVHRHIYTKHLSNTCVPHKTVINMDTLVSPFSASFHLCLFPF